MSRTTKILFLAALSVYSGALAEQYSISNPTEQIPTPVRVAEPIEGRVEVTNFPEVQEITGEVGLVVQEPLQVQLSTPLEFPEVVEIEGIVEIDDANAVRVTVENFPKPAAIPVRSYIAFVAKGDINSKHPLDKKSFPVPKGKIFHLTDIVVDVPIDLVLSGRITAPAGNIAGIVAGMKIGEIPLAVLDTRQTLNVHAVTPTPLINEFSLEVMGNVRKEEAVPFSVVVSGYLIDAPVKKVQGEKNEAGVKEDSEAEDLSESR